MADYSGDSILRTKAYALALEVTKHIFNLQKTLKEYSITNQLIRSITSIGANLEEAQGCQSQRDFFAKLSIAYKEAFESRYWVNLITDLEFIDNNLRTKYIYKINELIRMIAKSRITMSKKED